MRKSVKSLPRLLLFDLDGTLLRSDKTISQETVNALASCRDAGILIGICTARSEENARGFIRELEPDVLITSGGALAQYRGETMFRSEFTEEETRRLIDTARAVCGDDCEITIDTMSGHFWNYKIDPRAEDQSWGKSIYTDFSDFHGRCLKMCVEIFEPLKAKELQDRLGECDCVRFSDGYWYKFTRRGATKENAIREICLKCGIRLRDITAFGDDVSDMEMLKLCGRGIAMGNAVEAVKETADEVIGTNDADGIAVWLNAMLAENGR